MRGDVRQTAPPPGYLSLAAFNIALVAHVEAQPTLHVPPKDHPTYHNDALEITGPPKSDASRSPST